MAKILEVTSATATIGLSLSRYFSFGDSQLTASLATETFANVIRRSAGTASNLYIRVNANTITAASTLTSRVNELAGAQSVSITASTTGEFSDAVNSDAITAGQRFDAKLLTGGTGTTISYETLGILFNASSNTVKRLIVGSSLTSTSTTTLFIAPTGGITSSATESTKQYKMKGSGTLQNGTANVSANARADAITVGTRINGVNGAIAVSIPLGSTGNFEDTVNTDAVVTGNLLNYYIAFSIDASSVTIRFAGVELLTTDSTSYLIGGGPIITQLANVTNYLPVGGSNTADATEANLQQQSGMTYTAKNLQIHISANTVSAASTFALRVNGSSSALSASITANTTGFFEDTSNAVNIVPTDELNYILATGATGTSLAQNTYGHMITPTSASTFIPRRMLIGIGF